MGAQSSDMPGHRTIGSAWLWAILLVGLAALSPHRLAAQSPSAADSAVQVGDRWTYESKDEISGEPKDAYTQLVTEISPKEIVVNVSTRGKSGSSIIIYDHDWNRIATSTLKFQPNDGQGIRLPLAVGKEWRSEYAVRNVQGASAFKAAASCKVTGQETLTTPAGTFETFKIEKMIKVLNVATLRLEETQVVVWYAPQINHWVRATFLQKFDKRTSSSRSDELTEFARKP